MDKVNPVYPPPTSLGGGININLFAFHEMHDGVEFILIFCFTFHDNDMRGTMHWPAYMFANVVYVTLLM